MLEKWIQSDRRNYRTKKSCIRSALHGSTGILDGVTEKNKEAVFYMLLFCLCVPQSKAIKAEEAINILRKKNYYSKDLTRAQLVGILAGRVRFQNTKADRLIQAKKVFFDIWGDLKNFYTSYKQKLGNHRVKVLKNARTFLITKVNGMGMKLASHFLRNVGMPGLAILDVHIIAGLKKRGLITEDDVKPLTKEKYEHVSQMMGDYAERVGISIDELDMLFWSHRTGFVFK